MLKAGKKCICVCVLCIGLKLAQCLESHQTINLFDAVFCTICQINTKRDLGIILYFNKICLCTASLQSSSNLVKYAYSSGPEGMLLDVYCQSLCARNC